MSSSKPIFEYERIEYTPYGELWVDKMSEHMNRDGKTPFRFTGKEQDEETGFYYYGARYLNPKTSLWISADPAMGEYIPSAPTHDEARKRNGNLPGMGGVFNYVNMHVYHYAGNNPLKYTDPDGNCAEITRRGNKIEIVIPVRYAEGTTNSEKSQFRLSAQGTWSGKFGEYEVTLIVVERDVGEYNTVEFAKAENKDNISNVADGRYMTLYDKDLKAKKVKVIAHEVGHLMNLRNKYRAFLDSEGNRTSIPKKYWEKNIMGTLSGNVDIRNIDEILKLNTVKEK
jgi:RHS repeat-associated protein